MEDGVVVVEMVLTAATRTAGGGVGGAFSFGPLLPFLTSMDDELAGVGQGHLWVLRDYSSQELGAAAAAAVASGMPWLKKDESRNETEGDYEGSLQSQHCQSSQLEGQLGMAEEASRSRWVRSRGPTM
jgi:hypothetical protein